MDAPHSPKIGLIVEITREFGRGLCRGVAELANETGTFNPFLIDTSKLRDPAQLREYEGFIARVMNDRIAQILINTKKPVVDVFYDKPRSGFAIVKTRHSRIGALAAEHFIERKFKNFAYCGFAGGRFSTYCKAACVCALLKHGAKCKSYSPSEKVRYAFNTQVLINEQLTPAPDASAVWKWLKRLAKPVAVFCPNDLRAWQLLQICKQHGVDVPREVAILGLDNDILVCGLASPMISSVDPDTEAIGRCAAQTLLELIERPSLAQRRIVRQVDPVGVVERASTEVYPLEPPWLSDALVFIGRHIGDNLTASDVYRRVGFSHTQVDKIFRAKLGTTVQKTISEMRLEKAQRLLMSTRWPLSEVAARCGFSTPQYLIKSFTGKFKCPPAAWRARRSRERVGQSDIDDDVRQVAQPHRERQSRVVFRQYVLSRRLAGRTCAERTHAYDIRRWQSHRD